MLEQRIWSELSRVADEAIHDVVVVLLESAELASAERQHHGRGLVRSVRCYELVDLLRDAADSVGFVRGLDKIRPVHGELPQQIFGVRLLLLRRKVLLKEFFVIANVDGKQLYGKLQLLSVQPINQIQITRIGVKRRRELTIFKTLNLKLRQMINFHLILVMRANYLVLCNSL